MDRLTREQGEEGEQGASEGPHSRPTVACRGCQHPEGWSLTDIPTPTSAPRSSEQQGVSHQHFEAFVQTGAEQGLQGTGGGSRPVGTEQDAAAADAPDTVQTPPTTYHPPVDLHALDKYMRLPLPSNCLMVEYIWVTRQSTAFIPGQMMRSKCRVLYLSGSLPTQAEQVPPWDADGLSISQGDDWSFGQPAAQGRLPYTVHMTLRPVKVCTDPFRGAPHLLALCEAVYDDDSAPASNHRARARAALAHAEVREPGAQPWFAFEQEYTLFTDYERKVPLGFSTGLQGEFLNYCGVGADVRGRAVQEAHLRACLFAGLHVSGVNLEVLVGSCEYQVGPGVGIDAGDQLWLSRYILARLAEEAGVYVSFDPKPLPGHDGCGLHSNFSTEAMRQAPAASSRGDGDLKGWDAIVLAMGKFAARHRHHLAAYGPGNERRLTGGDEYSSLKSFSWGVGDRGASVRVSFEAAPHRKGCGYFEDRRPGSNADSYLIILQFAITLWGPWQDRAPGRTGQVTLMQPLSPRARMEVALATRRKSSEDVTYAERMEQLRCGRGMARGGWRRARQGTGEATGEGRDRSPAGTSEGDLQDRSEIASPPAASTGAGSPSSRSCSRVRGRPVGGRRWPWNSKRALSLVARMPPQTQQSTGRTVGSSEDEEEGDTSSSEEEDTEDDEAEDVQEEDEEDAAPATGSSLRRVASDDFTDTRPREGGVQRPSKARLPPWLGLPVPPLPPVQGGGPIAPTPASRVLQMFRTAALETATSLTGEHA